MQTAVLSLPKGNSDSREDAERVLKHRDTWIHYGYDELKRFHRMLYGSEPDFIDKIGYWFETGK